MSQRSSNPPPKGRPSDLHWYNQVRDLKRRLTSAPHDATLLVELAGLYWRQGKMRESILYYRRAAQSYTEQLAFERALKLYEIIQKIEPDDIDAAYKLSKLYEQEGRTDEAQAQVDRLESLRDAEWLPDHSTLVDLAPPRLSIPPPDFEDADTRDLPASGPRVGGSAAAAFEDQTEEPPERVAKDRAPTDLSAGPPSHSPPARASKPAPVATPDDEDDSRIVAPPANQLASLCGWDEGDTEEVDAASELVNQAEFLLEQSLFQEAKETLRQVLDSWPDYAPATQLLEQIERRSAID